MVVRSDAIANALRLLSVRRPRGCRLDELFLDVAAVIDDVRLLHRNGMIELRSAEPLLPPGSRTITSLGAAHRLRHDGLSHAST